MLLFQNSFLSRGYVFLGILAFSITLPAAGQIKKKQGASDGSKLGDQRSKAYFDVSRIVWPNPPAIPRIRFSDLYTGEKVDPNQFSKANRKPKQKWMDRLAGATPVDQMDVSKLPFQLIRTYGVAVDSKGTIYAADQAVGAIFMFDLEGGVKLIKNGKDANFGLLNGLAIDDNDRLFVTDVKLNRVVVFNAKHQMETTFGGGILSNPGGLAIDKENRLLYVVDTGNDVVRAYDADSLKPLRIIGTPGKKHTLTDPGTFSLPTNVAVDGDGNVYVTDTFNNRVEIFDADGVFLRQFGKHGDGVGQFELPKGIAIDCDGHVWVVDAIQDRVKVFDREGQLLIYFGEHGEYPGRFMGAFGITIDKDNRVIVSETFPGRVQIFRYVSDAEFEKEKQKRAEGTSPATPAKPAGDDKKSKGSAMEAPRKSSAGSAGP
ncbi:MAG TPA: SMP-30/gluconolactonase/LRE family protein [Bryobacteraceae bacterium]|nr:SMP-30/gluconolactonase/LRE family protein [Bryobacteraceae bacterium]